MEPALSANSDALTVLYQDEHLVAIHKPAGLLVHRTGLDAGETRFALQMLRDQLGRMVWPVHRLDKGTSGLLLMALSAEAAQRCAVAFEQGQGWRKTYVAVVRGWPAASGEIDHPLRRMEDDQRAGRSETQPALTRYQTLWQAELPVPHPPPESSVSVLTPSPAALHPTTRVAGVLLWPLTGRRHQLRRHMKHIAHPLVGDATHGKGPLNRALAAHLGLQRLWLHAWGLSGLHPVTGEPLNLMAPLGPEWALWPGGFVNEPCDPAC